MSNWEWTFGVITLGLMMIIQSRSDPGVAWRRGWFGAGIALVAAALAAPLIPVQRLPALASEIFSRLPLLAIVAVAGLYLFTRWRDARMGPPTRNDDDGPVDADLRRVAVQIQGLRRKAAGRGGDPWDPRFLPDIRTKIRDTFYDFDRLNHGEIRVIGERACHQLYVKRVLGSSQTEIWTTNVPGTFGRRPNAEILHKQRDAIERHVKITRTFLVPEKSSIETLSEAGRSDKEQILVELATVMQRQKAIGVHVCLIGEASLKQVFRENPDHASTVGSYDFMIIDDRFAYITHIGQDDRAEDYVFLTKIDAVLHSARQLREEIGLRSRPVSAESLALALDGRPGSGFTLLPG